jgi:hypothetical protein
VSAPKPAPARLYGFLATKAPKGVILRRGPTDWYQLILWHTDTDTFEFGQWFHGTIYPRVCDLSPDGSFFIYFAAKHALQRHDDPTAMYKWTAISRPPYYTALAMWPIHHHFYLGGGHFISSHKARLYADALPVPIIGSLPDYMKVSVARLKPDEYASFEESGLADAWTIHGWVVEQERVWDRGKCLKPQIWRKDCVGASYALFQQTENYHQYAYFLRLSTGGKKIPMTDVTWADWDLTGSLVFAKAGKLFTVLAGAFK